MHLHQYIPTYLSGRARAPKDRGEGRTLPPSTTYFHAPSRWRFHTVRYFEYRTTAAPSGRSAVTTAFPTVKPRSPEPEISPYTGCHVNEEFADDCPNDAVIASGPVMNSPAAENICASGAA